MKLGFGLEGIGLAALARPKLFGLVLLFFTAVAGWHVPKVDFNGSLMSILPDGSESFLEYQSQKDEFRDFSRDVAVILKSPRLLSASGLEDLRSIQLELALVDGVSGTASLFSIPDPDPQTGELRQFFPAYLENDEQANSYLSRLLDRFPAAANLVAVDEQSALIVAALELGGDDARNARAYASFREIKSVVSGIAPADFEIKYAGLTPIGLTILETLVRDQVRLTILGLFLGALVAIALFRSPTAALICAVPPALTAIWSVGLLSMLGISINYLTTVLPTLALILAYADGIVLYHCWNRENVARKGGDSERMIANLSYAVRRIGPATSLTSITTAIAIASFMISRNAALVEFGWLGVVFISFAFLAVITALPVTAYYVVKLGWLRPGKSHIPSFSFLTRFAVASGRHAYLAAGTALVAAALMFVLHNWLQPEYRVTDYLPTDSETLAAETVANETFGGRSILLVTVPTATGGGISAVENRDRLQVVTQLLRDAQGSNQVFSLTDLWEAREPALEQEIADKLQSAASESRHAYISRDGNKLLLSVRMPSSSSITEVKEALSNITPKLDGLDFSSEIVITGFPVLVANEFTTMINQMRNGLLIAIAFGIFIVGLATRSPVLAVAVAVPNVLPVLLIESLMYMRDGTIILVEVVGLTVAFGIAIDNAVHVINFYTQEKSVNVSPKVTLEKALAEVAPALAASTFIICTSVLVTFTSDLPSLPIIGKLVIATLFVALFTNLVILPSYIISIERFSGFLKK